MLRQFKKLNKVQNFSALYGIKNLHDTSHRLVEENTQAMDSKHFNKVKSTLIKYDKEQENRILKIINNYNLNDLLGYEISKGRASRLLAWRVRFGSLKSLDDVFSVEGFGTKVADKFFQSLLLEPKPKELNLDEGKKRISPFVTPTFEASQRQAIKSTVSVRIGVNSITWSRLDIPSQAVNTPCLLTHWQHHEISEKKLHLNELVQRCLYVHHLIPAADCYLFENPQMAQASNNPGSVERQNINIQKAQVIAIMGYALASRKSQLYDVAVNETNNKSKHLPNVYYVKRFLSARLFNHLVGAERVSSEKTILNMMRTFYNTNEMPEFSTPQQDDPDALQQSKDNNTNLSGRVQFPSELRTTFSEAPPYCREFMGQVLLLNLAFVQLVLLQDSKSIAILSKGGNKAKANSPSQNEYDVKRY